VLVLDLSATAPRKEPIFLAIFRRGSINVADCRGHGVVLLDGLWQLAARTDSFSPRDRSVYPFSEATQAYKQLARGAFGKVVIKVAE
jgi:hypothetical protein